MNNTDNNNYKFEGRMKKTAETHSRLLASEKKFDHEQQDNEYFKKYRRPEWNFG